MDNVVDSAGLHAISFIVVVLFFTLKSISLGSRRAIKGVVKVCSATVLVAMTTALILAIESLFRWVKL